MCPGCGSECEAVRFGGSLRYLCDSCAAAEAGRRRHEARRVECLEMWRDVTPLEFQEVVQPDRLPEVFRKVMALPGTEGVGLIGPSGTGKTRLGYRLLKKASAAGLKPYAITQSLFRQAVADRTSDDRDAQARARTRLQAARHAQALLLDDVGKGARTDAADEALYELLTHRRDKRLVTHWTANQGSAWIASRYGADRGPAIAVRLAHLAGCHAPGTGRIFTA